MNQPKSTVFFGVIWVQSAEIRPRKAVELGHTILNGVPFKFCLKLRQIFRSRKKTSDQYRMSWSTNCPHAGSKQKMGFQNTVNSLYFAVILLLLTCISLIPQNREKIVQHRSNSDYIQLSDFKTTAKQTYISTTLERRYSVHVYQLAVIRASTLWRELVIILWNYMYFFIDNCCSLTSITYTFLWH